MLPKRRTFVYGLRDPRDGAIYYVGHSHQPLARVGQHSSQRTSAAYPRAQELRSLGMVPELVILSEHQSESGAWVAEGREIESRSGLVNRERHHWWKWLPTRDALWFWDDRHVINRTRLSPV